MNTKQGILTITVSRIYPNGKTELLTSTQTNTILLEKQQPTRYNETTISDGSVLKNEYDFTYEGILMGNCMSNKFFVGNINYFLSISNNNETINAQFNLNGDLINSYGKFNSIHDDSFINVLTILSENIKSCIITQKIEKNIISLKDTALYLYNVNNVI